MENKELLNCLIQRFNFSSGSLNERMISQKAIYILQEILIIEIDFLLNSSIFLRDQDLLLKSLLFQMEFLNVVGNPLHLP